MKYESRYDLQDEVFYIDGRCIKITKIDTITITDSLYKGGLQITYAVGINADIRIFDEKDLYKTKEDAKKFLIEWVESL